MSPEENKNGPIKLRLFTPEGKPLRVLSTSLGIALLANALYAAGDPQPAAAEPDNPGAASSATTASSASSASSAATASSASSAASTTAAGPVLVEWSSEEVKAYFDPSVDWNIPLPEDEESQEDTQAGGGSAAGAASGGSGGSGGGGTIVHTSSGFGWDDLMLYHLIFNRGGSYSSGAWHNNHSAYDARSGTAYTPRSYGRDAFQNKPVVGSAVRPKTSESSGTITRRSTSSSPGGIGGRSSGFTSSGSSHSSGGFGG
ncbi:hypothetical protein [Paenibacillus beijingensis]|uniref:Uncharacterized protein n=1 Tax=Paenibacillus beijingensis TaxID=1126833 RepID=A0A0D5NFE0_9BACL|nr:hypothetical protein [Paenibacillus beijingensis]AJY73865.1 hypothetical protein VN24_03600 [Paenibacillus beijingensis]